MPLIVLSVIVGLIIAFFVAARFEALAEAKGHPGKRYFWLTFFLGVIGMAEVAALPDLRVAQLQTQNDRLEEMLRRLEAKLDGAGLSEAAPAPAETPVQAAAPKPVMQPLPEGVVMPLPDKPGHVRCPICGTVQRDNRTLCFQCGVRFPEM